MKNPLKSLCVILVHDKHPVARNNVFFAGMQDYGIHLNTIKSPSFRTRILLRGHTTHLKFWLKLVPAIFLENFFIFFFLLLNIRKIIISDAIYAASYTNYTIFTIKFFSVLCNKKIIFDAHGSLYFQRIVGCVDYPQNSLYAKFILAIDKLAAKVVHKYVTLSDVYSDAVANKFKMKRSKFITMYGGTTLRKNKNYRHIEKRDIDLLHLSSFKEFHGTLELIDITNYLVNVLKFKKIKVVLAGHGKLLGACYKKVAELNLKNNVFLPGHIHSKRLVDRIQRTKVVIGPIGHSDLNEIDIPTKVVDYLSFGRVSLLPDTESMHELITEGVNGFFCDYRDIEKTAKKIAYILQLNKKKLRSIEDAAFEVHKAHLIPKAVVKKMLDQIDL